MNESSNKDPTPTTIGGQAHSRSSRLLGTSRGLLPAIPIAVLPMCEMVNCTRALYRPNGLLSVFRHRPSGYKLTPPLHSIRPVISINHVPALRTHSRSFSSYRPLFAASDQSPTHAESYATPILDLPRSIPTTSALALVHLPYPSSSWPSHIELESQLVFELTQKLKDRQVRVLACVDHNFGEPIVGGSRQGKSQIPRWGKDGHKEIYRLTIHTADGRTLDLPEFDLAELHSKSFEAQVNAFLETKAAGITSAELPQILVCTHGARDCRCADIGGDLVEVLRDQVKEKGLEGQVRIGECSHLGGHKFAANAIMFPSLHIMSNLRPSHGPALLSHLIDPSPPSSSPDSIWQHFKGSFGLSAEEQEALFISNTSALPSSVAKHSEDTFFNRLPSNERIQVEVKFSSDDGGEVYVVDALVGESLMEVAKRHELGVVEGACGGALECATCHIYLPAKGADPNSVDTLSMEALPDVTDDEEDMLGYAIGFDEERSRLGCQIKVSEELSKWSLKSEKGVGLPSH